jgi:quinol monooxygenase YgiN
MKIITVHCYAKPETRSELIALCKEMIAPSRAESGCLYYSLFQDFAEENHFFFYEEWKDQSAIDFHMQTAHYKEFQKIFDSFLVRPAELKIHSVS